MIKSQKLAILFVLSVSLFQLLPYQAFSQDVKRPTRTSQYYISKEGSEEMLLMRVNIWGLVLSPGQYMVPDSTDLVTLISFAGGPLENARLSKIEIIRSTTEQKVIKVNFKEYLKNADPEFIPILKPGDTVIVRGTTFHLVSKIAQVVSQFAIVANVYYWFFVRGN